MDLLHHIYSEMIITHVAKDIRLHLLSAKYAKFGIEIPKDMSKQIIFFVRFRCAKTNEMDI